MSVWEENFGWKTEGKGAGSRSAWRFDLLWRIVCEIVCYASVPQPHLKKNAPAATGCVIGYNEQSCINTSVSGSAPVSEPDLNLAADDLTHWMF